MVDPWICHARELRSLAGEEHSYLHEEPPEGMLMDSTERAGTFRPGALKRSRPTYRVDRDPLREVTPHVTPWPPRDERRWCPNLTGSPRSTRPTVEPALA